MRERVRPTPAESLHEGHVAFGLSFSALIIILLCFFVYLDAQRKPDAIRESNVFASLDQRFADPKRSLRSTSSAASLRTSTIINTAERAGFDVLRSGDTFTINLPSARLFQSGSEELDPLVRPAIERIGEIARIMNFHVRIEGHTDNQPIATSRFQSNWELSAARAIAVLKVFHSVGVPDERLAAAGRGEFLPIAPNTTEEGRAANRRVTVILSQEVP